MFYVIIILIVFVQYFFVMIFRFPKIYLLNSVGHLYIDDHFQNKKEMYSNL